MPPTNEKQPGEVTEINRAYDPQRRETLRTDEATVLNQLPSVVKQVALDAINKVRRSLRKRMLIVFVKWTCC